MITNNPRQMIPRVIVAGHHHKEERKRRPRKREDRIRNTKRWKKVIRPFFGSCLHSLLIFPLALQIIPSTDLQMEHRMVKAFK
jgi:hypothetical protein